MLRKAGLAVFAVVVIALAGCSPARSTPPDPPPRSPVPVRYADLEQRIEDSIVTGAIGEQTVVAVLVSIGSQTRIAHYRHGREPAAALHVGTVTPSVMSALIGIAIEDHLIGSLDQTLPQLLPRYAADISARDRGTTLRQLMTMTAGFPWDYGRDRADVIFNGPRNGDPTQTILRRGSEAGPGTSFYSSAGAHLVSAVLRESLRRFDGDHPRTVLEYARDRLFDPLGIDTRPAFDGPVRLPDPAFEQISTFGWGTDTTGLNSGCCLLRLRPADLVKIGELYRNHGRWQDHRLCPAGGSTSRRTWRPAAATTV